MSITSSIGRMLVPIAVVIVFAVSRRYLPATSDVTFSEHEANEFSRLQWLIGALVLGVAIALGFFGYKALLWSNAAVAGHDSDRQFLILPGPWTWFFLPLFGAICLSWELTLRLWRLLGDSLRSQKYEHWSNSRVGFNATRVLQVMTMTIVLPIAIATILALPIHASINRTGMRFGHFGTLRATEYRYSDITRITVTDGLRLRDGSLQKRPAITLDFTNGTRWSSASNRDPQNSIDEYLLNFLRERTHLTPVHLVAFPFGSA